MTDMPEEERDAFDEDDVGMPGFDEGGDIPWEDE